MTEASDPPDRPGSSSERDVRALRRRSAGLAGLARCELVECLDGPARGQRRLEIDAPSGLSATVLVDRSLDLLSLRHRGRNVGWRSAARARHPVADLEEEEGLGLMRSFDGLLVTCGLDHAGLPETRDAAWLRYPPRARTVHPLHGRLPGAGVTLVGHGVDLDAGTIFAEAHVHQGGVFTEVLILKRRLEIDLFEPVIRIRDVVINDGFRPTPHRLLYHVNAGHPLLGEAARLYGDGWALADLLDGGGATPADDHVEQVDVEATPDGPIGIENRDTGLFLELATDAVALPLTALWRAYQSGVFALGIEPQTATGDPEGATLAAGERRDYRLDLRVGTRGPDQLRSTSS